MNDDGKHYDLQYDLDIEAERERVDRWWRTYDAALTGCALADWNDAYRDPPEMHLRAAAHATQAHGPLVKS